MPVTAIEKAIALIKEFESFSAEAYPDPKTRGKPITIGWGSTRRADGGEWYLGDRIDQSEAEQLLRDQIQFDYLPPLTKIPCWGELNSNQQAALISFAYNLGAGFFGGDDFATITRVLRDRDFDRIESAMCLYCNPGTSVEDGLRRRRLAEARLFQLPDEPNAIAFSAMNPAAFRTIHQTFLKKDPHSAASLPPERKIELPEGVFFKVTDFAPTGKHYKVTLEAQQIAWERQGIVRSVSVLAGEWYVYGSPQALDPHVEVYPAATCSPSTQSSPSTPAQPLATFKMRLPQGSDDALITGTFDLIGTQKPRQFTCTSGQPGYQYQGSTHMKGKGPLPSCAEIGIDNYWILTEELERFETKGIEGYAFHIVPDPVEIRGIVRGEFMVHNDTNRAVFPGSSGCIVFIFDNGWNIWRDCMKELREKGIEKIPLKVLY